MGREPGIGPAQLTCPNTDTDHSDQSVPVLFAPLFLEGRNRRWPDMDNLAAEPGMPGPAAIIRIGTAGRPES